MAYSKRGGTDFVGKTERLTKRERKKKSDAPGEGLVVGGYLLVVKVTQSPTEQESKCRGRIE